MAAEENKICLNCGRPLTDEVFCPQCGQHSGVTRLSTKNFLISVFAGLTRVNRGFVYTCWRLLISPWTVISDYIKGKRTHYTSPVQTLLIICFIAIFLDTVFHKGVLSESSDALVSAYKSIGADGWFMQIIRWYADSPTLQYLLVFVPAVPAFMLVTRKKGVQRYNLAESMVAAIYISSALLLTTLLIYPLNMINERIDFVWITYIYVLVVGTMGVYRAVRPLCKSRAGAVWRVIVFYGIALFNYILLLMLFGIIVALFMFTK